METRRLMEKDKSLKKLLDLACMLLDAGARINKNTTLERFNALLTEQGKTAADIAHALHLRDDEFEDRVKQNIENYNFREAVENVRSLLDPKLGRKDEEVEDLQNHLQKSRKSASDLARALSITEDDLRARLSQVMSGHVLLAPPQELAKIQNIA